MTLQSQGSFAEPGPWRCLPSVTPSVREQRGFTVGADRTYMALPSCCRYGRQLPDPRHRCDVLQGKRREESERGKRPVISGPAAQAR